MFLLAKKFFVFLKPDWKKVAAEAKAIEATMLRWEKQVGQNKVNAVAFIEKLFKQVTKFTDANTLKANLQMVQFYVKWKNVPIDYAALAAIPTDFDPLNSKHLEKLINSKMLRIEKALEDETVGGVDLLKTARNAGAVQALAETRIPLIRKEFESLQNDCSPVAIVKHTKALYGHLAEVAKHEATEETLITIKKSFQSLDLSNPRWENVIAQLQILASIPEGWAGKGVSDIISLIKSKARELLKLVNEFGLDKLGNEILSPIKQQLQKVRLDGIVPDELLTFLRNKPCVKLEDTIPLYRQPLASRVVTLLVGAYESAFEDQVVGRLSTAGV